MHGNDTVKSQKILIVDSSRVVRASLARRLHKTHVVCEEGDGESAWQSLVLDASIIAVISGLDIGSLDGAGLIERMRASKLARLNGMPFYLLASDSMPEAQRQRAIFLGVSDFIPKASPGPVLHRLFVPGGAPKAPVGNDMPDADGDVESMTSSIGLSDFTSRIGRLAGLDMGSAVTKDDGEYERRLAEKTAQHCVEQHLAQGADKRMASVLIFGIDGYADLCEQFGRQMAEKVVSKFSALLAGKIQEKENVLHLAEGRIGIVSANVTREQCASFARRVCKALASASIGLGGRQISATVSAGISAVPQDGEALGAEELLYLATHRLDAAQEAGGNQVVFSSVGTGKLSQDEFVGRLKTLLANSPPVATMSCKSWLRSICIACRDTRPEGDPPPCSAGLSDGLCGGRQATKH
ncbi:MAG: diguanylate cyclase [Dechloromonas sp.]|nr:MAG: diguanylate cyclase [Dechloromonas sp.]